MTKKPSALSKIATTVYGSMIRSTIIVAIMWLMANHDLQHSIWFLYLFFAFIINAAYLGYRVAILKLKIFREHVNDIVEVGNKLCEKKQELPEIDPIPQKTECGCSNSLGHCCCKN